MRNQRGSVAAELALALPAVLLALLLGVGALGAAARQVTLQDAAADAARLLGRGEGMDRARSVVAAGVPDAAVTSSERGELVCVTAASRFQVGRIVSVPLRATSCALTGGL